MQELIKGAARSFFSVCRKSVGFVEFLMRLLWKGRWGNPFKKERYSGKVTVLANGPSLKEILPELQSDEFSDTDFIVMNFFGMEDVFARIKPKHYCLADPMFFHPNHQEKRVRSLFSVLNEKVDWNLNLYMPATESGAFKAFSAFTNKRIHIVPLNVIEYKGFECFRHAFYRHGLSMPVVNTVANMAVYIGINSGYSQIDLYGVDHTFFDSMCVNGNNQLCNRETHFYDDGEVKLKPILRNDNSQVWKISDYVTAIGQMFRSHDLLAVYARSENVRVVNCTECSLIDSYERKRR